MCQEAILTWFRQILGLSHGTTFLDLSNGIIVGKLLNQFKPLIFKEFDFQEINFVMNFARISTIVQSMLIYDNTLEPVIPRKITDSNDDCETNKFVYNTIKIIMDWNLAKEELNKLRRDQIQYIYDFIDKEEKIRQTDQLLKKITEFEELTANQEHQIEDLLYKNRQLQIQCDHFHNEKIKLQEQVNKLNLQLIKCDAQNYGTKYNEDLQYLKQNIIDLKQRNHDLQAEIQILRTQLEQLYNYENKCRDLEREILIQRKYCSKEIVDELQQKNKILKEQVKNLDDCSRAQKENSSMEIQHQQEISELQQTINKLREQIRQEKPKNEQLLMTPKPPKPKQNCLSDQKTQNNEEKLMKQNQLLRKIINNLEIQSMGRRKSLNG